MIEFANLQFYKEKRFKETPIGKIPEDWEVVKLEDIIVKLIMGQAPPSKTYNTEGKGVPFVKATEFGAIYPKIEVFTTQPIKEVDENFILLSIAGTIGLVNKGIKCAIGRSVAGIKPDLSKIDYDYLYYFLNFASKNLIGRGSSQKIIVSKDILSIKIIKPKKLEEQKTIAHVLSTVDKAIQKTNEIIEKIKRLKKGLMQELLTKGIGHKEFKDTEIGRIPKEWKVVKLGDVLILKNGERPQLSGIGTIPVYGANGIMGYTEKYLVDNDFTIVIGRVGASGEVHLGVGKIWISDNAIYSSMYDKKRVHLPFLYYLLKHKQLSRFATKTTHPIITQSFLKSYKVQLPPLSEQQKIAEILSTVDKTLEIEKRRKEKLERIKKSLMDLLLTGKIRIKIG